MELWRMALAPVYAACLLGLLVAAFAFGRKDVAGRPYRVPLLWFGALAVVSLLVLEHVQGAGAVLASETVVKALGSVLLVLAAGLALRGGWARSRANVLRGSAPVPLDEAVADLRAGHSPGWGVYHGVLDAEATLTSPGGVACVFFDAEVREVAADGRRGALLSRERAYAPVLALRGQRVRATVSFSPASLMAPVEVRRCKALPGTVPASWYQTAQPEGPGAAAPGGMSVPSTADAHPGPAAAWSPGAEPEALSWERVGTVGESCLVVGELRRGPVEGCYVLGGREGGPALVVLGPQAPVTSGTLARRAWRHFAAAGVLSMAAAVVLSRAL
ncbi:hypothetical protein [Corallococcus macrosporus]|uniref:Uncharacterized protein n=1 Tax=Myxococcus fulvus (strain ATCC BAA-855 / HW-1) TaxID=483219 RepID=F8CGA9_MYXFH|nr:hypothetical protein [Corallococcus macrosporus]AEI67461.1 hypothetical protein LILAB_27870 [Corallococcus macrosporus]